MIHYVLSAVCVGIATASLIQLVVNMMRTHNFSSYFAVVLAVASLVMFTSAFASARASMKDAK